jgi:hypothetical protein
MAAVLLGKSNPAGAITHPPCSYRYGDPRTLVILLFGAMTRAGLLIAGGFLTEH